MADQYFLKWNNHQSTLLNVFSGLLESEQLTDCILSAEGMTVRAHQVVISACSPYLEKLLNESRVHQFVHPVLIFNDLKFEELKAMREYMYKGEVNVTQENLNSFLKAAQSLQVKGLADQGGGDEGGGGGKRKTETPSESSKRRRRRNSREENCDSESSSCDTSVAKAPRQRAAPIERFEPMIKPDPDPLQAPPPPPVQLKTEPEPEPEPVQDLTLDDDEYEDYGEMSVPGTSQADLSTEMANWQMDGSSMNSEDFAAQAAAAMQQQGNTGQNNTQDGKKFECNTCGRSYTYKKGLQRHQKFECGKEPQFPCPHCPYKAKVKPSLKSHMVLKHSDRMGIPSVSFLGKDDIIFEILE